MDPESSRPNHLSPNSLSSLRLKKVLKSYQQCAPDSLNGPNYYHPTWINGGGVGDHHHHLHHHHHHPRGGIKYPAEKYTNNSSSIVTSPYSTSSSHNSRSTNINLTNNNHHKIISNNTTTTTATAVTAATTTTTTTTTTNYNNHNNNSNFISNNISHSNKANNINPNSNNHHNNSSNHSNHTNTTSPELSVSSTSSPLPSSASSSSAGNTQRVSSSSSSSSTCSTLGPKNELNPPGKLLNSDGASKSSSNSNQININNSSNSNSSSSSSSKINGGREKGGGGGGSSSSSNSELSSTTTTATTTTTTTSSVTKLSSSLSTSSSSTTTTSTPIPTSTTTSTLSNQVVPTNIRIPPPIIIPADPDSCQRSETILEGEVISCFIVGGEKRLCLPQILNTVLTDFSLQQINSVCDELHIFCSRCTPEQLEVLKVTGILPVSAPSCGLITKTDAERLCAALLFYANRSKMLMITGSPSVNLTPFPGPPPMMGMDYDDLSFDLKGLPVGGGDSLLTLKTEKLSTGLPVTHKCFGQCSGILYTDLYTEPISRCIKCSSCGIWLTPQRFVTHIHASTENHTCHWGFDSYNWRAYIHLDDESKEYQCTIDVGQLEAELDSFKSRFDPTVINTTNNNKINTGSGLCNNNLNLPAANKRKLNQSNKMQTEKKDDYDKQTSNSNDDHLLEPLKKIKTEEMATLKLSPPSAVAFLTSPYPPPYHLPPPPPPPSLLPPPPPPTSASSHSLHHSYHHFPVSTNWTPDPSVFSYWYHHPNLSSSTTAPTSSPAPAPAPSPSSVSSTLPSTSSSVSATSACTTSTTTTTPANHHNHPHPSPNLSSSSPSTSLEKNRQGKNHQHLFSNLDKLLRRNKVHSDLRVQIFKEIENIIEEVRSTGNDNNVVVDTTPS